MTDHKCSHCCRSHCAGLVGGIVFLLVAIVHIVRLALGWTVIVDGHEMPIWCSIISAVIATGLGAWLLCCACCKKCKKVCTDTTSPRLQ